MHGSLETGYLWPEGDDALELLERSVAEHVDPGLVAKTGEDLYQLLRVLVRASPRGESRIKLGVGVLGGREARATPGRPKNEVHGVGLYALVTDEGRVKFEGEVSARNDRVHGQHVRSGPRAGCLALYALVVERQVEIDKSSASHGTARYRARPSPLALSWCVLQRG